jgi:hypothetical protein
MKTGFITARLLIVVFVLALMLGSPQPAVTGTLPIVSVWPTYSTACTDGQIAVRVENVSDLYAYDVYQKFTPGVINVTSVENGGFLESGIEAPGIIDNDAGTLSYGLTQINPQTPKTGSGNLIIVHFTVLQLNQTVNFEIEVDTDLVHALDNAAIEYTIVNGVVATTCQPPNRIFLPLIQR